MDAAFYAGDRRIQLGACEPVEPGPGEVQVKVSYCGICGTDLHIFQGAMDKRVTIPQVIGHEMSGVVRVLGPGVTGWAVGDRVTVMPLDSCGHCPACKAGHQHICHNLRFLGVDTPGALQGSWTVPAHTLHPLPPQLSQVHAALIEPLAVACHDVRLANVKAGMHVVVLGAGTIGMLVSLVSREAGANVLVSEINPFRAELAQSMGLHAVNPLEDSLDEIVSEETGDAGADIVFEVSGSAAGARLMTGLLRTRGLAVVVAIFGQPVPVDLHRFFWRELRLQGVRVYEPEDFDKAIELAATGSLPLHRLITAVRPLNQLQASLEEIGRGGQAMKIVVEV